MKLRWQTQTFQPIDQILSEQEQVEVGLIGEEVTRGDVTNGVVPLELLNDQFDAGAIVVEAPEVERLQAELVTRTC